MSRPAHTMRMTPSSSLHRVSATKWTQRSSPCLVTIGTSTSGAFPARTASNRANAASRSSARVSESHPLPFSSSTS